MSLLDAIRAEIEPLEARLSTLREMEMLALAYVIDTSTPPAPAHQPAQRKRAPKPKPAAPRKPKATTNGRDGLGDKSQAILGALREHGDWASRQQIADRLSEPVDALNRCLPTLVQRGLVEATGVTKARRYRAVGGARPASVKPPDKPRPRPAEDRAVSLIALREKCLRAVRAKQGDMTDERLAEKLGADPAEIADATGRLRAAGKLTLREDGTWMLGPRA